MKSNRWRRTKSVRARIGSAAGIPTAVVAAVLALASCQSGPPIQSPRDFEAQWHDLLAKRDFAAAERLINQRASKLPDDPDVAIARANLYFRQATGPSAGFATSRKPPGAPDSTRFDTLLAQRALETLRDGIQKHPGRLDMRFGLMFLCQQCGLRIAEDQLAAETIAFARAHPDSLQWLYGEPLPEPADEFLPKSLHDFVRYYVDRGAPGDDRAMLLLGELVMRGYPNSPYVPNDIAFYYGARGDWKTSLGYLQRAERADSTDALVLYNLGWAHEQLKQRDDALRYYRRALVAATAGRKRDVVASSSQRLAALGAKP